MTLIHSSIEQDPPVQPDMYGPVRHCRVHSSIPKHTVLILHALLRASDLPEPISCPVGEANLHTKCGRPSSGAL